MNRLLHDRYLPLDDRNACDLATGKTVRLETITPTEMRAAPRLASFVEALEHGRDGVPRWLVAAAAGDSETDHLIQRAAREATACGYVPIAVGVYRRVRELIAADLQERSLVLIGGSDAGDADARSVLVDAAARSPRPHLLLTIRSSRVDRGTVVREARAVYAAQPGAAVATGPRLHGDAIAQLQRINRGVTLMNSGRHAAADRLFREAASALSRRGLHAHAAQALMAAGRLSLERGRANAAEELFEAAAERSAMVEDDGRVATARIWQAAAKTDGGRLTGAEALCRAMLVTSRADAPWRPLAEATLARVLLWQGRLADALQLRIVDVDDEADGPAPAPFVSATVIRLLLAGGRIFEAGQRVRRLADSVSAAGDDPLPRIIAATASLRLFIAAGDLAVAETHLRQLLGLARQAHLPLRAARARLLWVNALRRAGRTADAAAELRVLTRLAAAGPPLLGRAIGQAAQPERPCSSYRAAGEESPSAAALVQVCNAEERDADGVSRVVERLLGAIGATRVEVCSAPAGLIGMTGPVGSGLVSTASARRASASTVPVSTAALSTAALSTIVTAGTGLPTSLGCRVIEAGIAIGPEQGGHEVGVPVRLGPRLLGALVARWPADRGCSRQAPEMMALVAAIVAPRLEVMQAKAVDTARAATLVPELLGVSTAIDEVRRAIARAAVAPFAVLVEGESGVGKELVARAIHHLSARRQRRFCDINCAALPDDLLESELFGHARGAFTGAVVERPGLFEDADGGTLFLDEVADLSPRAQAKLLRVLQQHEVRRVGETFSRKIDVRIVAAANRDMHGEAAAGRFRTDLLYRLDVIRMRIPPLRERPADVAVLAAHFWAGAAERVGTTASLTHGVLAALAAYHWPGNVRELQNVMAALAVAAPSRGMVRASLLPAAIAGASAMTTARLAEARTLFERRFVEAALARAGGSRTRAARELGVSRQGLAKLQARLQT